MTGIKNHTYEKHEYDYTKKTAVTTMQEIEIHEFNLLKNLEWHGENFIVHGPIDVIENLFKHHGNEIILRSYLNNFDMNIQGGLEEKLPPIMKGIDPQTTTYEENMGDNEKVGHSEKHMQQTIAEFWKEIQKAMVTCGINQEEVKKMYEERTERIENGGKYVERREYIYKKIRPIYIQLRKEGYTSQDLTY